MRRIVLSELWENEGNVAQTVLHSLGEMGTMRRRVVPVFPVLCPDYHQF